MRRSWMASRSAKNASPRSPPALLATRVRGIFAANDVEPVGRVYQRVQGTGSHPAIQGNRPAGRILASPVLTIVLALGAVSARPAFPTSNQEVARSSSASV